MCRKGRFVSEDQYWSYVSMSCPFQEHHGLLSLSHCALRSLSLYGTGSDLLALQDFPGQIAETLLLYQRVMGVHQTFVATFPLLKLCLLWFCLCHAPTLSCYSVLLSKLSLLQWNSLHRRCWCAHIGVVIQVHVRGKTY